MASSLPLDAAIERVPPVAVTHDASPSLAGTPGAQHRAERSFDAFNLFVANIQTGFGPFIAVYLSSEGWTQTGIGFALSVGTVTAMISQIPAGAAVDALRNKTRVATLSVLAFTASALMFAAHPIPLLVYLAEVLHGISSCTLGPAIASLSLLIAGPLAMGLRLGRNARYAAIGNGVGAALMGACGSYISDRAVFVLTAILTAPALVALWPLRRLRPAPLAAPAALPQAGEQRASVSDEDVGVPKTRRLLRLLGDRRLTIFALCALLFTFANAPMLPLASNAMNASVGRYANLVIAACITLPQVIGAIAAPWVGRRADAVGRRGVLLLGFCMLPLRGVLLSFFDAPTSVIAIQALDGISAACFGVMVPLITADIAVRSGHYTLCLGVIGFAMGLGGTFSTTAAGWVADHHGVATSFMVLGGVGLLGCLLVWLGMPETRPKEFASRDLSAAAPAAHR